jgi:hypothetical protein
MRGGSVNRNPLGGKDVRAPVAGGIPAGYPVRFYLDGLVIGKDLRTIANSRTDMTTTPTTMHLNMISLTDDALIIDDDIRAPLDNDNRRITVPARIIDVPSNYRKTHKAPFLIRL